MTRVISFSSGKGGVGKTTLVGNVGSVWASSGKKVLLVDGDWALGKLGIALGVNSRQTVEHALMGKASLGDTIQKVRENLFLLASPSGVLGLEELSEAQRHQLFFDLEKEMEHFDVVLFDHASGVDWDVLHFAAASHQHVIVTTAEPTACADAYAIMKILSKRFGVREFWTVVTMSSRDGETESVIRRFCDFAQEQLLVRVTPLGVFPWDERVVQSIRRQRPFVELYPTSELSARFRELGRCIDAADCRPTHGRRFLSYRQDDRLLPR